MGAPRPSVAQQVPSPGPPDWLVEAANQVQLGVRVEGGFMHARLRVDYIERRQLQFLKQRISPDLAFTGPLYGVSAALRTDRIEVRGAFRTNEGLQAEGGLHWSDGSMAIPTWYKTRRWRVQAHYFFHDNVGVGVAYRDAFTSITQVYNARTSSGAELAGGLFGGQHSQQSIALFVPGRYEVGPDLMLFGRIGLSVYGTGRNWYGTRFVSYQEQADIPDRELAPREDRGFGPLPGAPSHQFLRVGVERALQRLAARLSLRAERLRVGRETTEWRGGVRLELGLPF